MTVRFAWPLALAFGLLLPLAAGGYLWWLRRRRNFAVRYSSLALIREALPSAATWRRHTPPALLLLALACLTVGAARPQVTRPLPANRTSIILAMDVSRSMCAIDVAPNRLAVAQDAARTFVAAQAGTSRIGIVTFSGTARLLVAPTNDPEVLIDAIDNFRTGFGTALGRAQLTSIDAISDVNPAVAPAGDLGDAAGSAEQDDPDADARRGDSAGTGHQPDIIVLLTDGANSTGPDPLAAARLAAERGVRVFTIGFGTDDPGELICGGTQIGADRFNNSEFGSDGVGGDSFGTAMVGSFGGGGGRGGEIDDRTRALLSIDEPTLRAVAETTGGAYFRAADAAQLVDVFAQLPAALQLEPDEVEVSAWFTAAALALVLAALALSYRFHQL